MLDIHALKKPSHQIEYALCHEATESALHSSFTWHTHTHTDENGRPWDDVCPEQRERTRDLLRRDRPALTIGTPMCKAFSILQCLNRARLGEHRWQIMPDNARVHLQIAMDLCRTHLEC